MKIRRIVSLLIVTLMMVQMMPVDIMATAETENQEPAQEEIQEEIQEKTEEEPGQEKQDEQKPSEKESAESEADKAEKDQVDEGGKKDTGGEEDLDAEEDSDKEEESDADFIKKKKIEAVDVQGEAAMNKSTAAKALRNETDMKSSDIDDAVDELFDALRGGEDDQGDSADNEDPPRQGDGSNIEIITAKWITPDSVDNGDPALLYRKPSGLESQSVRLQVNYALSGEHKYEPGDITITVPAYLFENRNGKKYGGIIVPYPEDPSMRGDFNWKQIGDNIIITNTRRMSAATKGYIQLEYDGLSPQELVDMETSAPFDAYIEVKTHLGNIIALRSNELTAQFDTEARLTNVNKRVNKVSRVSASQIPENQRIAGEDEYIKVDWYVWGTTKSNTYYTITQTDSIPQDMTVESRVVVADDEFVDENTQISYSSAQEQYPDKNYRIGDTVVLQTEADIKGFIIGGGSSDSTSLTKPDMYRGYKDGNGSYYYFSTAYPASQFEPDIQYTFHNTINYTVKEVDPAVTENTNPNVQRVDPQLVTGKNQYATAQVTWSYSDPKWIEPGGHYMVHKNGNDDKGNGNITHKSTYTSNDLHLNSDGYYGIYPSALNKLQDEYRDHGTDGSVRLSYTINTIGYTMPWMYDGGYAEFQEGEFPTRIIGNYNRPITMTTTDTGISIGRNTSKLTVLEDYTFAEIEFPNSPYVFKGKPQNLKPDGTWTAMTAGDGTFKYTRDNEMANWPDITLQIQRNGEWEDWAVASWKTGSRVVTLTSGGTAANGIVKVPADTQNFRTVVTTQNTAGGEGATEATQAGIEYDVRAVVNLKSTQDLIAKINEAFTKSNLPQMAVYNGVNMLIERADEAPNSEDRFIHSINREGYDSIRGYTTDTSVYPYKEAEQKLKEVDYEARTILIHYTGKVEIRSIINERKTWQEAVDEGRLDADRHGFWRDLLPKGVTPDLSTIKLRSGDKVVDAYTIENYKESGRTLLVVECDLKPTPVAYRSGDMTYYEDIPTIKFDAIYDFESLKDFGYSLHNVISFETGNDHLGTIRNYTGEPDDPYKNNNAATARAFANNTEKDLMKNLDPDRDDPSFVYAGVTTRIDILNAARTSLYKDVQVNNDGIWSEGTYYRNWYGNETEATEGGRMRTVYEGGQYSYRLRVMSDPDTVSTGMIILDSLENFYAKGDKDHPEDSDNDVIDVDAPRWHGVLREVDTSQLEELGCDPVIYYSTIADLQLSDESDPDVAYDTNTDINNTNVWIKASNYTGEMKDVKAVAIDCRKAKDNANPKNKDKNGNFRLQPLQSAVVFLRMQAPSGDEARDIIERGHESDYSVDDYGDSAMAYNNSYLLCTSMDEEEAKITDYDESMKQDFVRKDYTKVGLKEYSVKATKVWNDDKDRDGIRPDTLTFTLYADGEPAKDANGEIITRTINVKDGEKEAVFEHIPYTWPNGEKIHYTIEEEELEGYTAVHEVKDETLYAFTNTHEPEKVNFSGAKTWEGDNDDVRPSSIDIILYANGTELKRQTVKPDAHGEWHYEFKDLFKRENGEIIEYTIKEAKTKGTGDKLDSYETEITPDGSYEANLHNIYHPYGDLDVTKIIKDATSVSEENMFEFTFLFSRMEEKDGVETEVPTSEDEQFDYEVLDENGDPVMNDGEPVTGKVGNNGTVEIKGGQTIHVKEIPEWINYSVTEATSPGFSLIGKTGDSGQIVPNQTAEAEFTNKYQANGQINLGALKKLYNRILNKYQFRFELYKVTQDDEGEEVEEMLSTASSDNPSVKEYRPEDGTVDYSMADAIFGVLRFTQEDHGKTYKYKIIEIDTEKPGYTYFEDPDGNRTELYTVEVTVTDNGDGTLDIKPVYKNAEGEAVDEAIFNNTYKANGNTMLRAWKNLPGRDLEGGEFTFELLDKNGDPIMNSGSTDDEPSDDPAVELADDQGTDPSGNSQDGTDGDTTDDEEQNSEGSPVTAENQADGTVLFDPENVDALNYTEKDIGKTFYYAIREKEGTDSTITYDDSVFGYMVTIIDNGDGTLFAEQRLMKPIIDEETGKITDWTEIGAELPVFENELKDGSFSITKTKEPGPFPDYEDPDQKFKFKVRLIGEKVTDETVTEYTISSADDNTDDSSDGTGGRSGDTDNENTSGSNNGRSSAPANGQSADKDASAGTQGGINLRAAGDIAEGTYDSLDWRITSDGTLVLGNGTEQTLTDTSHRTATGYPSYPWRSYKNSIKSVRIDGIVHATGSIAGFFYDLEYVTGMDLTGFDTSAATSMYSMFHHCYRLESLDVSMFDTSNCTNMRAMFNTNFSLKTLTGVNGFNTSKVTTMDYMFSLCESLTSLDISSWNTGSVTTMYCMLNGMPKLTSLKMNLDTSKVTSMYNMFGDIGLSNGWTGNNTQGKSSLDSLKSLDISTFNTARVSDMTRMFSGLHNLEEIKLSPDFRFKSGAVLNTPKGDEYTGRWINKEGGKSYTPEDLAGAYNSSMAGTWVWEKGYRVYFDAEGAAGSVTPVTLVPGMDQTLPANAFSKPGYEFDHWVETDENGNFDSDSKTYSNMDTIPAGTYNSEEKVYLLAVFEKIDTSVEMKDGEFEIELKAGEKATFDNIPAGTAYQIFEETPQGWVLIRQVDASGVIEPLETADAKFVNQFDPTTVSVQFHGVKTLDHKAVKAGDYSFVLKEDGEEIQRVSSLSGGFIQFDPIKYDHTGTYVYTIEEVDPEDDTIDYDTHQETVTVKVAWDENDDLVATVEYDEDGVRFSNMTRPGNLRITKVGEGANDINNKEFTFKITFTNADGMPLGEGDSIYWTKEGENGQDNDADDMNNEDEDQDQGKKAPASNTNNTPVLKAPTLKQSPLLRGAVDTQISTTDFAYTGNCQTYVVPANGIYQIEVWGAQGGSYYKHTRGHANNPIEPTTRSGIKGGYSVMEVYLEKGQELYVAAGGAGGTLTGYTAQYGSAGGWNGGGKGGNSIYGGSQSDRGYWRPSTGGGGATSVAVTKRNDGRLSNYNSYRNDVLLVAGGGGGLGWGSNWTGAVGYGGGESGGTAYNSNTAYYEAEHWTAAGGTQTSGYQFGVGQEGSNGSGGSGSGEGSGGGGGGWYGGRSNACTGRDAQSIGGGGGSGHVNTTYSGYRSGSTKAGNDSSIPVSPAVPASTGFSLDGYARITPLEIDSDDLKIYLDANGGFSPVQWLLTSDLSETVSLPVPTRPGYLFAGWNTDKNGDGDMYNGAVTGEALGAQLGEKVTLYAQWLDEKDYAKYTVEYYRQNADGNGYSLYEADHKIGHRGDTITPDEKEYVGYIIQDHDDSYTVPQVGQPDLVVKYYYNLLKYYVVFDGNGATSGQMNQPQEMLGGKQYELDANKYQKKGSLFTGWNTEPDGGGKNYTDKQRVKNLTTKNGATVTLYAQWLDNSDHELEPTNGEIIVKCKAGETIFIPDLPAGTTYTIEEIDNPAGWTQKGEIEGNNETITANVTNNATVTNEYKATGEALVNAHKTLEGAEIDYNQFSFDLLDSDGNVLQTVKNGLVDSNQQVENDEGDFVDNPYYDTAIVQFSALEYDESNIGETYTYFIREVVDESDVTYEYDRSLIEVQVTVNDFGNGTLVCDVKYKDPQIGEFTSGEHIFKNKVNPAKLRITKEINEETEVHESEDFRNDKFTFTVALKDKAGTDLTDPYTYYVLDENGEHAKDDEGNDITGSISSGGTVSIKGGQTVEITGLPDGTSYEITESEVQNWEQTSPVDDEGVPTGAEGELEAGITSEETFTNLYHEPQKGMYNAEGSIQFEAKKRMEGGFILEDDNLAFELVDSSDETGEQTQTKSCDKVSSDEELVTESKVTFDEIHYELSQLEYPEAVMEAENTAMQFIKDKEEQYNELKQSELVPYREAKKAYDQEHAGDSSAPQFMSFEEWYKEQHDGEEFPDFDTWFSQQDDTNGKTPLNYLNAAVELAQAQNPREGTFIYYVREIAGDDPDVIYDNTRYYYKVRVVDNGDGTLTATPTMYKMGTEEDETVSEIRFINSRTTQIKVYKRWVDNEDQDGYRPSAEEFAQKIHLMNGDTEVTDYTPIIREDEAGNLTIIYEELPAYDNDGNKITYTVKEDDIDQYTAKDESSEVEDGETMMNTHTPEDTEIEITKTWNDASDQDGYRPSAEEFAAKVHLLQDGTELTDETPEVIDNEDGTYTVKYTGLTKYHDHGTPYVYSIKEDTIDEYKAKDDVDEAVANGTIINEHEPDETEIEITKAWDDAGDQDGYRPSAEEFAAKVHLLQDGTEIQAIPRIVDNIDGTYTVKYTGLTKYHNHGTPYVYSIKEDAIDEYEAKDGVDEAAANGTITNEHEPDETEIEITKTWNDANDQDGYRPSAEEFAAKVHLLQDGTELTDETPEVIDNEDGTYTVKYTGLTKYHDHGTPYVYSIKEDTIDEYKAEDDVDEAVANGTIINEHEPDETEIEITKTWDDAGDQDGYRPSAEEFAAKVHLLQDGTELTDETPEVIDNEDGTYTVKYTGLTKYHDHGTPYVYSIKEDAIDEYEAKDGVDKAKNGETITNKHEPEERDITVRKIWDDQNDICGRRDGVQAQVQLYSKTESREKMPVGDPVDVGTEDDWSYTWTGLPVNENKERLIYSVEETLGNDRYYTSDVGELNEEEGTVEVTNTSLVTDLVIRKSMPVRVSGEGENATIAFKVVGKDSTGEVIYTSTVGFAFNDESDALLEKTLKDVPIDAEITVTEVYSGNYAPEDEEITKTKLEKVDGTNVWLFEFENAPDDNDSGSGAVNKYEIKDDEVKFKDSER